MKAIRVRPGKTRTPSVGVLGAITTVLLCMSTLAQTYTTLVPANAVWQYRKGTEEASQPRSAWRTIDFDDAAWSSGAAPIGYGSGTNEECNTTLTGMRSNYVSFFMRVPFTVGAIDNDTRLRARVDYDDGFILWINGERVLDKNEPDGDPLFDSVADESHESGVFEDYDIDEDPEDFLEPGADNVVAVQVFNANVNSSDCKFALELQSYKRVADTQFSHDRGFYDTPFDLTIRTKTAGATIRYTTDGSVPSLTNGAGTGTNAILHVAATLCVRAAAFKQDYAPTDIDTQTYVLLDSVVTQPPNPAGFPSGTWETSLWGVNVPPDYGMDPTIVTASAYSNTIRNDLKSLPTLSIVMDRDDMFGSADGVYNNGASGLNSAYEKPTSVELIYPDGRKGFQIDCGIRPHTHTSPKRSFKLLFRSEYGEGKLRFPLFQDAPLNADSAADVFDRLVLRAAMNMCYGSGTHQDPAKKAYARDQWARDSQIAMRGFGVHGTHVHLYIDGLYWGLYNIVERPDTRFSATYFGGEDEEWYGRNHGGDLDGDPTRYNYFRDTQVLKDQSNFSNYNTTREYVDVEEYCDYVLLAWYGYVGDWAGSANYENNYYLGNRNMPAGPTLYYVWDAELTLLNEPQVHDAFLRTDTSNPNLGRPFRYLWKNPDFRALLADRLYKHLKNGGVLAPANAQARWLAICDHIEAAMVGESARWGDARQDGGLDYGTTTYHRDAHWYTARDWVHTLMANNDEQLLAECRTVSLHGYPFYPPIDPPEFSQHGGAIGAGFNLTMTNPNGVGTLVYRTDGSDPRASGGTEASGTVEYSTPLAFTRTTHVTARVRKNDATWSAVHTATYNYTAHYPLIRITELHYNPLGGRDFEFVEIQNVSDSTTVGLSEIRFDKGLDYTFAPGTELGPRKFAVLVRNEAAFTNRYPTVASSSEVQLFGVYAGTLDNGGERVRLVDCDGLTVATVKYNDKDPWPREADGDGFSLVYTGTDDDQDHAEKWRASNLIGGSPGYDEGAAYRVVINEALTHTDLPELDTVELCNAGETSVDIGGWYLSDTSDNYKLYQLPSHLLGAGGYKTYDENELGFQLSSHGDEIYLTRWDANDNLLYLAEARFGGAENGRAFGRYIRTDGRADFVAQRVTNTLGSANDYPLVGPVVINEIMYHPSDTGDEYIELMNVSDTAVPLYDPAHATNTWRLDGAVEYMFPTGATLAPGEICLVVATNSSTGFRDKYGLAGDLQIFSQYAGVLNNAGESLKLWRPGSPDTNGIPWILVDRVKYNDNSPWPESADGDGPSLERIAPELYGNDPVNWTASATSNGTPGTANSGGLVSKTSGWKYHDKGTDLGTAWRAAAYDDSGWDDGNAPLGYPDTDLEIDTEIDYGEDPANKHITTYFRKAFSLEDPADVDTLTLRIRYDDGYVAYLNGQEVVRGTMDPGTVNYSTFANAANGSQGAYDGENLNAEIGKLVAGVNVLAVEVHQRTVDSSDLFMDLELVHTVTQGAAVSTPTISPAGGDFYGSVSVTVTTVTAGATVFYTTDGSSPSDTHYDGSGLNSAGFSLTDTATVRAKAYKQDLAASSVASATFTDMTPTVRFASSSSSGSESQTSPSIAVELSNTSTQTVRVDYQTTGGGTASADDDYTATSGTLTFSPGQTQKSISVAVTDDGEEEDDETIVLQLSNPQNAVLGTSAHTYTIIDNDALFTAYNDLSWGAGQLQQNITRYTTDSGDGTPPDGSSGSLLDFDTGETTTVTLAVAGGNWNGASHATASGIPDPGTDAAVVFSNKVDCTGHISYGTNLTLTFSGMDPGFRYELVVFGNRDTAAYTGRISTLVLTGVESDFVNESTEPGTIGTTTVPDDTTTIANGYNTTNGLVARWTNIDPGGDGAMLVTVYDETSKYYVNALMLRAYSADGPAPTVRVAKGATWNYRKGTAEASDPAEHWRRASFDDSGWTNGPAPFGYGDGPYGTDVTGMQDTYTCLFLRRVFTVGNPARISAVNLWTLYDDGFIIWINGTEVARLNMSGSPGTFNAFNDTASAGVGDGTEWNLALTGSALPVLEQTNVLAVQVFNIEIGSSDLTLDAELSVDYSTPPGTDTDNDGLPDDYENERLSGTGQDGTGDKDSDGVDNLSEWVLGTDPDDDGSETLELDTSAGGGVLLVSFPTRAASGTGYTGLTRHYGLQQRADPLGPWSDVPSYTDVVGTNQTVIYTNTVPSASTHYRARVWLE